MPKVPTEQVILDTAWVFEGPDGQVRVEKASKAGRTSDTQQLESDPFHYRGRGEAGLIRPPYDMDMLTGLLGAQPRSWGNSLHTRCVKQKASDAFGRGISLRAKEMKSGTANASQEDQWGEFVRLIEEDDRGDGSLKERLTWAHEDFESVGWATMEVGRDASGNLDGLWHIPSNTIRAHADGKSFAQRIGTGDLTWFRRFGSDGTIDAKTGVWTDGKPTFGPEAGHELIVVRNYTPGSSYYGLPDHIPALAAVSGWRAQSEFNIRFFGNQAVPSYAVIIEGASLTNQLEEEIKSHFRQIKGDPARTIVIPIPAVLGAGEAMQPKIRFERLSVDAKEASFRMYRQDNALEILIAHGVPPYRVGWPLMGSMGGATAAEMTNIYKDSIVQPRQETWEQRLDRAILGPKGLNITDWQLKAAELDTRDESADIAKAKDLYSLGVTNPNDSARYFGYDERTDEGGKAYIKVPLAPAAAGAPAADPNADPNAPPAPPEEVVKRWEDEVQEIAELRKRIEGIMRPHIVAA